MNTLLDEEKEDKPSNVIPFKLAPKEPFDGSSNWLKKLPKETRFLSRPKNTKEFLLEDFIVASDLIEGTDAVCLGHNSSKGLSFNIYDSENFSKFMELYTVLTQHKEEQEPENGQ